MFNLLRNKTGQVNDGKNLPCRIESELIMNEETNRVKQVSSQQYVVFSKVIQPYLNASQAIDKANDPTPQAVEKLKSIDGLMATLKAQKQELKEVILDEMVETGQFKVDTDNVSASLRKGTQRLVVDDENLLQKKNPQFFQEKPVLDKASLKRALEFKQITGAHLEQSEPTLSLRQRSK